MTEFLLTVLRDGITPYLHQPIRTLELWTPAATYATPVLKILTNVAWGPR